MDTLPSAPPIAPEAGEIVLVVGAERLVGQTAEILVGLLGLGGADIVRCTLPNGGTEDDAARMGAAKVNTAVRVAKRRAGGATSLVALAAAPGAGGCSAAADVIECLRPHTVLAAVDASVKRADVARWLHGLGPVDALAVWDLDGTCTPGELLGLAPIAYADGTACSAIGWTAVLLARLSGHDPA